MHKPRTSWPLPTRVGYLVSFQELRKQHPRLSLRAYCAVAGLPVATFARWWRLWRRYGNRTLVPGSHRPQHCPTALPGAVLDVVRAAHRAEGVGVTRLHAQLTQAGLIACSRSSVYRILRRAGALHRRPRRPKPVWQRYAKAHPGERAQADLKYLPQGRFQLTLIDDCTRLVAATVLTRRTSAAVVAALPRLLQALPFQLRCLQTDSGPEFGQAVTQLLQRLGIRHARIRPRTPRLNGKVERVQRTMQEELWDGILPDALRSWEQALQGYLQYYNRQRLHSALGYQPPWVYAKQRLPRQRRLSHLS